MTALFAWGANTYGQLGLGFKNEQVLQPMRVEELPDRLSEESIIGIYGGGGHTFLLTAHGKLYGAGFNNSGQVGNGTQLKTVSTFELIRGLEDQKVEAVCCGWTHSVALSSRGQVWVWGSNTYSQLGLPTEEVPFSCLPICLDLSDVVSVGAGLRHTVVATKDGRVFSWGQGVKGQLGHIDSDDQVVKCQPAPKVVESLDMKVVHVACGLNTTYAITGEGHVLAWGDNKWGQLAHDPVNVAFFSCPLTIPPNYFGGERALWIRAGWNHCAVGLNSGDVYMWGRSDLGQLGPLLEDDQDTLKFSKMRCRYIPSRLKLQNISQLACGSEHNLAVVGDAPESGVLMCWGWNEHGSCGTGTTENVHLACRVALQGTLKTIGTGSGHSFAVLKLS